MKKLVVILSVLCFSVFVTTLKLESIFASTDDKNVSVDSVENVDSTSKISNDIKDESIDTNTDNLVTDQDSNADISADIKEDTSESINTDTTNNYTNENSDSNKNNLDSPLNENTVVTDDSNKTEISNNDETTPDDQNSKNEETVQNVISKDDALNILKSINPNLTYNYQGDENTFTSLKDKGLSGYVFLPEIDTDLGYFVDKNTSHVYYFHPSGYLELIK